MVDDSNSGQWSLASDGFWLHLGLDSLRREDRCHAWMTVPSSGTRVCCQMMLTREFSTHVQIRVMWRLGAPLQPLYIIPAAWYKVV